MTTQNIDRYLSLVTGIENQGPRTIYHVGERFTVEATSCKHHLSDKRDLMNLWKKAGYIPAVLPSHISITTCYTDEEGNCLDRYNVTHTDSEDGKRRVINFDFLREATPENERELVAHCIRMMLDGSAAQHSA